MRRREFITLLGSAAAAWPRSAGAQKLNVRRIGVLVVGNTDADAKSFQTELREECANPVMSKDRLYFLSSDLRKKSWMHFQSSLQNL